MSEGANPVEEVRNRLRAIRQGAAGLGWVAGATLLTLAAALIFLVSGLVVVGKGEAAILIRKTGDALPSGRIIAQPGEKGIQREPLPEGWYWRNPWSWDWRIVEQIGIQQGQVGVQIRNYGSPLKPGQVIAEEGQKGVLAEVLRPGRYFINTEATTVTTHPAVTVDSGHVGVVTLMSGRDPVNPNDFLVDRGERGVQRWTYPPGTYYVNPYMERIVPVDIRAHRFDMTGDKIIKFPSQDGFDITMEGTIEWYIDLERVSEVYVKYVDDRDLMTCVVDGIILPNARAYSRIEGSKHLARDFIGGKTRQQFQDTFLAGVKKSCGLQGIVIQSALVRQITPPSAIADPIKQREIAIRLREKYTQEMEREKEERLLKMELKMKDRKTTLTKAEADVAVAKTLASQEKEVAIIEANRQLEVAKLQVVAAKNQARAKIAEGTAAAQVIVFKNAAEAQGLRDSARAFGDGHTYVRYLMNQRLGPAMTYILSNTEGPFADILRRAVEGNGTPAPVIQEKGR